MRSHAGLFFRTMGWSSGGHLAATWLGRSDFRLRRWHHGSSGGHRCRSAQHPAGMGGSAGRNHSRRSRPKQARAEAGIGGVCPVIPSGRLVTFYGDDFSGSTDVMEVLAANGLETVLFLDVPDESQLELFPNCRAVGIAGCSRSQSPGWMTANLPRVFRSLQQLQAPLCHYKTCSTFDSSPQVGSIGRALEIGQEIFGSAHVPLIVGAPALSRYCLFGNLFATVDGETHRLDRHPTMSRHPVTPMAESDLRLHLAAQTSKR